MESVREERGARSDGDGFESGGEKFATIHGHNLSREN
jgi:hypothetical protein